jgi:hypothetical protein
MFRKMAKPDKNEEARQWALTLQLVGVAIGLACILAFALGRRFL